MIYPNGTDADADPLLLFCGRAAATNRVHLAAAMAAAGLVNYDQQWRHFSISVAHGGRTFLSMLRHLVASTS